MAENRRKSENIRRANRVIQTRTFVLMLIMGIGMFFLLFFKLYNLQITRHEELQAKAVSQQTRSSVVTASRGAIYDASGNILAISSTAETIFLSPKEINDALNDEENPVAWTKEVLAAALAKILDVSEEGILKKMARTDSMYEVLKFRVEEDIADQVRQYINDNKVKGVYAALLNNVYQAERAQLSNNANVITLGAQVTGIELGKCLVREYLANTYDSASRSGPKVQAIVEYEAAN